MRGQQARNARRQSANQAPFNIQVGGKGVKFQGQEAPAQTPSEPAPQAPQAPQEGGGQVLELEKPIESSFGGAWSEGVGTASQIVKDALNAMVSGGGKSDRDEMGVPHDVVRGTDVAPDEQPPAPIDFADVQSQVDAIVGNPQKGVAGLDPEAMMEVIEEIAGYAPQDKNMKAVYDELMNRGYVQQIESGQIPKGPDPESVAQQIKGMHPTLAKAQVSDLIAREEQEGPEGDAAQILDNLEGTVLKTTYKLKGAEVPAKYKNKEMNPEQLAAIYIDPDTSISLQKSIRDLATRIEPEPDLGQYARFKKQLLSLIERYESIKGTKEAEERQRESNKFKMSAQPQFFGHAQKTPESLAKKPIGERYRTRNIF